MFISAMLTSLPGGFTSSLRQAHDLGFTHGDVVALADRPAEHLEVLAETGLLVSCAALDQALPEGLELDSADIDTRQAAVELVEQHINDAATLGATHAYLLPPHNRSQAALARFADAVAVLADHAAARMVQLCMEHVPTRALSTVAATLRWLDDMQLDSVDLLLDVGHCLISEEDPAQAVTLAGERLGYVHFDDNDGIGDLHWPLLTGRLTAEMLDAVLLCLKEACYKGGLALELNPDHPDPVGSLRQGRALLLERLPRSQ